MTESATAAPAKHSAGESALARLVGVFVSPVRTFASIAARPTWLLPVAISAGLSLPVSELILSKTNWREVVSAQIAKSGRTLSEAQLDQAVEQSRRLAWVWDVLAVAAPILVTLIVGAVLWGACNAFGWEVKFRQSLGVTAHAFFPGVLYGIALLAVLWNRTKIDPQKIGDALPTNLGYFAPGTDSGHAWPARLGRPLFLLDDGPARPRPVRGGEVLARPDGRPRGLPLGALRAREGRRQRPPGLIGLPSSKQDEGFYV